MWGRGRVDEDDSWLGFHAQGVYSGFLTAFDLLPFKVHDFPFEFTGPSCGDRYFSGGGGHKGLGASVAEVEVCRLLDVGSEPFTVGLFEVDDLDLSVGVGAPHRMHRRVS